MLKLLHKPKSDNSQKSESNISRLAAQPPGPLYGMQPVHLSHDPSPDHGGPYRKHRRFRSDLRLIQKSGLFHSEWYLKENPDVAQQGYNPLAHYVRHGAAEGRDPNPFFDTDWYLQQNPDVAHKRRNPLAHYIRHGAAEGRDPSPHFDSHWYLEENVDVAQRGCNPLAHYIRYGLAEGRAPNSHCSSRPITDSILQCIKVPVRLAGEDVALFVTHSPRGILRAHVQHYLKALYRRDVRTVLIVMTDVGFECSDPSLLRCVEGLFIRENHGYDFAAWAHLLKAYPELYDASILYLLNDSVFGPFNDELFAQVLAAIRCCAATVVGLTDSYEKGWHLQSYFLAIKSQALSSRPLRKFWDDVRSISSKQSVIDRYERRFAGTMQDAGLSSSALFPSQGQDNPTLFRWEQMIDFGFPFLKVSVVTSAIKGVHNAGWRAVVSKTGYDMSMIEERLRQDSETPSVYVLSDYIETLPAERRPLAAEARRPLRIAFIGPWNYANGLGVASRGYLSALWHTDFIINLHPIKRPFHTHGRVAPMRDVCSFVGKPDVALVHLNPDAWPGLLLEDQKSLIDSADFTTGLWVWEMGHVPENWKQAFDEVDAIWAPSQFCAEIFSKHSSKPVDVVPYVVSISHSEARAGGERLRHKLRIPSERRLILYAFDGASYLVRKNPHALVKAFRASGLANENWMLVLKAKNLYDNEDEARRFMKDIGEDENVIVVDQAMNREELVTLLDDAAIYASPHCSEGFGLTIAEAMACGKIVVATDYGGSRDFFDSTCGYTVPASLVELDRDYGHYAKGGVWAQIDEEALSHALTEAAAHFRSGDCALTRLAVQRVKEKLSPEAVALDMMRCLRRRLAERAQR